jgi:hypothetical protein
MVMCFALLLHGFLSRTVTARLYEEMLKLFLRGFARPVFPPLESSGPPAALFPELSRGLTGNVADEITCR